MKRTSLLAALLLAAALGAAATRAVAQSDPPAKPAPSPYEYTVFLVDGRDFHDKDDWKEAVAKADGNEFRADPIFKAYILNHVAKEGWELVQVVPAVKDKNEIVHFYLRRPKPAK